MSKLTIFSIKCVFPYIWRFFLHINGHKTKSNESWVKYDPILWIRKKWLSHISKEKKFIFLEVDPLILLNSIQFGYELVRLILIILCYYLKLNEEIFLKVCLYYPVKARGGSGVIFACLAHMKVPFITEQPLFTERRYRAVSKSYWPLKFSRRTACL